jgi:hypothetical protein
MRPPLAAPLAVSLLALSTPAAAGPVSQVANGIENKVETHQDSSGGAGQSDNDNGSRGVDDTYYDNGCIDCGSGVFVVSDGGGDMDMLTGPARLDLYLGGHAVVDSQGALVGEVRLSKDWLGISASNTRYFEEVADDKGRSDSVRMDLMAFALNARLFAGYGAELWIDGGLAASSSTEYDAILGTAFGLRAEQQFQPDLAVVAQGRFFSLEADVSAFEGWAGVRAWFLSAGYRMVHFNVGPPLHGPEAGFALRF